MSPDSDRESKRAQYRYIIKEKWYKKQKQLRNAFSQTIGNYQREFNELVARHHEIASNLLQRLCLSLLSFVFSAVFGLFLTGLMASVPSSSPVFLQGLLFGWGLVVATVIVYGARLLIWIRKVTVVYWQERTPPFESKYKLNSRKSLFQPLRSSQRANVGPIFCNHLSGGLLVNSLMFYGVIALSSFTSFNESLLLSDILFEIGKAVGLLYGGVVGLFITGGSVSSSLVNANEITALLVVFGAVIPSIPLTIAIRNFGHWIEISIDDVIWSQGLKGKVFIIVLDVVCLALLIQSVNFYKVSNVVS